MPYPYYDTISKSNLTTREFVDLIETLIEDVIRADKGYDNKEKRELTKRALTDYLLEHSGAQGVYAPIKN